MHLLTMPQNVLENYWRACVWERDLVTCNAVSGVRSAPWCEAAARVSKALGLSYVR
jgi:hypothetical protein